MIKKETLAEAAKVKSLSQEMQNCKGYCLYGTDQHG